MCVMIIIKTFYEGCGEYVVIAILKPCINRDAVGHTSTEARPSVPNRKEVCAQSNCKGRLPYAQRILTRDQQSDVSSYMPLETNTF
jgi:hypothetical protein